MQILEHEKHQLMKVEIKDKKNYKKNDNTTGKKEKLSMTYKSIP